MAMDYEVDFGTLEAAGRRAGDVAQAARAPLSRMRIDGVGAAIPGGVSGAVADRIDDAWTRAADELGEGLARYAEDMSTTAANYRAAEEAAAEATSSFFGGLS